jgi:D-3-phosphoglycerate dehydrogenase
VDIPLVTLDELLSQSDVISFHCPLNQETRNLICPQNVDRLKDGVFLVNTARGHIVDEDFLAEQIASGKIGGVALDAFASEPPDCSHVLFSLPQAICTPHIGAMTRSAQAGMATGAAREIKRVLIDREACAHNIFV